MTLKTFLRALLRVGLVVGMAGVPVAHGETMDCTPVSALPATISTQGIYCLTGNLATSDSSGSAITITANNVTLDLNGWKLGGQAAGTGTSANGIYSTATNVTIKNGIVRGFFRGIWLAGRGAVVEDMLVDQITLLGIYTSGQGAVVRRNQVVDTGGATTSSTVYATGIYVTGAGTLVEGNLVSGLTATGSGWEQGIRVDGGGQYSTVRHNTVIDDALPTGGGTSNGIASYASQVSIIDNSVTNFINGVYYGTGATGVYSRNTVVGCTTAFTGTSATAGSANDSN